MADSIINELDGKMSHVTERVTIEIKSRRRSISQKLRFEILHRDGFKCRYCGRGAGDVEIEIDHVHPVAKGGTNEPDNLVSACFDCNSGKSDRVLRPLVTRRDAPKMKDQRAPPPQWRGLELFPAADAMFYWNVNEKAEIVEFYSERRFAPDCPGNPALRRFGMTWGCAYVHWNLEGASACIASWLMSGFATPDALYEFYVSLAKIKEFGWARIMVEEADCHPEIQYKLLKYKQKEFS